VFPNPNAIALAFSDHGRFGVVAGLVWPILNSVLKKRQIRELAMQILFLWDSQDLADRALAEQIVMDGSDDADVRRAALDAAAGTWEQRASIDQRVERIAPQWPPRRQPGVDRNLIRLAVWEMSSTDTPPKVVIDEAIEMAKSYSTENSAAFVNGVLDAILKEHNALTMTNDETRITNQ
jgi:N utilization substance protein B